MREALAFTAYLTLGPIPPDDSLLTGTSRRSVPGIVVCPPEAIRAADTDALALAIVRHHLEHQDRQGMWGPHGKAALEILQRIEQRLAAIPPTRNTATPDPGGVSNGGAHPSRSSPTGRYQRSRMVTAGIRPGHPPRYQAAVLEALDSATGCLG